MHILPNWNLHDWLCYWKNICLFVHYLCTWICRDCNKWWHIERLRMYIMLSRLLFCCRRTFMHILSHWHLHDWIINW